MISAYAAQSFEIVSRDSQVSRIEIESHIRNRQIYLLLVICVLCIGFFFLGGRPDWTNGDKVGLATSVVFVGGLLWQHYSRSHSFVTRLTTIVYTAGAVFFVHAIWSLEVWTGEAGAYLFPSTLFSYSVLILITLNAFFPTDNSMLKTLYCASIFILSMIIAIFYVVATDQLEAVTILVTSSILLGLGLPLVALDHSLWLRFINSRARDRSSVERAIAARLVGPLLISVLSPLPIMLVLVFVVTP